MYVKHKVFLSYHHALDQHYKDEFERLFGDIVVNKSVGIGDINTEILTDTIRDKIRDEYLRDSTVTIVLIGKETWKRKFVDWEISTSIRQTKHSSRSGLLGIILPTHPNYRTSHYTKGIIPPRLHDNVVCKYAELYNWTNDISLMYQLIQKAFETRGIIEPDNSYDNFKYNKSSNSWD